ncbi:hypothetical protein GWI33_019074 [Rhynchophorus ferrugineus]|uniref:Uncharacterized protein n=1 Tax=Rhynchophorus ferrugineus TaxID=354439 RepID=A0A834M0U0_RHYFE|nr:hypothetical protein GWI33_019074 [Rhynchophorus ferrugineus]
MIVRIFRCVRREDIASAPPPADRCRLLRAPATRVPSRYKSSRVPLGCSFTVACRYVRLAAEDALQDPVRFSHLHPPEARRLRGLVTFFEVGLGNICRADERWCFASRSNLSKVKAD